MKNKKLLAASLSLGLILGANETVFAAETAENSNSVISSTNDGKLLNGKRGSEVIGNPEAVEKQQENKEVEATGSGLDAVAHKKTSKKEQVAETNEDTAAGRETIVVGDEKEAKESDSSQANQKGSGIDSVAHKSNNDQANENTAAGRETIVVGDKDKANNEAENNSQSAPEGESLDQVDKQDKASGKENTAAGRETIVVGDKDNNKDQANADRTQSGPQGEALGQVANKTDSNNEEGQNTAAGRGTIVVGNKNEDSEDSTQPGPQGEKLGEVAEKESEKDSEDKDSDDTNAGSNPKTGIGSTSALAVLASAGLAYISSKRK